MIRTVFFNLALLTAPQILWAEGSVSWDDVVPLLHQNPTLQAFVETTLDVEPSGTAMRLGAEYENLSGMRVAPYRFSAKPKGDGGGFSFDLVIEAESHFYDPKGQKIEKTEGDPVFQADRLEQILVGVSLLPLPVEELPQLRPEEAKAQALEIRKLFNDINMREARISAIDFADEELPMEAKAVFNRHPDSGLLELITVDGTLGDHAGFSESFYFADSQLIFVFRRESHWTFHPQNPNSTIDTVKEERFYFHDGGIFQAVGKEYEGGGPEKLQSAANAAETKEIPLSGGEATRFFSRASRLMIARSPQDCAQIYREVFR